jgi:hypothetical protein
MKLLIMQFSPISRHLIPLRYKYSPQHPHHWNKTQNIIIFMQFTFGMFYVYNTVKSFKVKSLIFRCFLCLLNPLRFQLSLISCTLGISGFSYVTSPLSRLDDSHLTPPPPSCNCNAVPKFLMFSFITNSRYFHIYEYTLHYSTGTSCII